MSELPFSVSCPTCKKNVVWNEDAPYRPFCSQRCRDVDLGAWSFEEYRIAGAPVDPEDLPTEMDNQADHGINDEDKRH